MIGLRGLTALALACAASVVACSSSSGGSATTFACADQDPNASANQACVSCLKTNCGSELSTAFGSGYSSGDVSGGDCGSFTTCSAACACNDNNCTTNCLKSITSQCTSAESAVGACEQSKCGSECASAFGGGGGGGGDDSGTIVTGDDGGSTGTGGPTGACFTSTVGVCIGGGLTASECSQAGGTTMSKCPAAGVVGCCTVAGLESCFYSPETTDTVMMSCTSNMGTFSAQP